MQLLLLARQGTHPELELPDETTITAEKEVCVCVCVCVCVLCAHVYACIESLHLISWAQSFPGLLKQ